MPNPDPTAHHAVSRIMCLLACLWTSAAYADVSDQLEYRYYTAQAVAGKSLFESLQDASPIRENGRVFLGHTDTPIEWRLQWRDTARDTCKLTDIRISLHASIMLPQLTGADPDRQTEYSRFLMALRIHETGHYRLAQQAVTQMDAALAALPEMNNCRQVEESANETAQGILADLHQKNAQYDATTNHGRTQGAILQN